VYSIHCTAYWTVYTVLCTLHSTVYCTVCRVQYTTILQCAPRRTDTGARPTLSLSLPPILSVFSPASSPRISVPPSPLSEDSLTPSLTPSLPHSFTPSLPRSFTPSLHSLQPNRHTSHTLLRVGLAVACRGRRAPHTRCCEAHAPPPRPLPVPSPREVARRRRRRWRQRQQQQRSVRRVGHRGPTGHRSARPGPSCLTLRCAGESCSCWAWPGLPVRVAQMDG
jgi:hypothetical protein